MIKQRDGLARRNSAHVSISAAAVPRAFVHGPAVVTQRQAGKRRSE
jgi:hypothetical protein